MRAARQAMTLIEILVVVAIVATVGAVALPTLQGILDVQQTGAARQLAMTYTYLRDEAALRNVSFRVAYNLDEASYRVEVGPADATIFSNPEDLVEHEEQVQDQLKRFTQREIEEGEASEIQNQLGRFEGLKDPALEEAVALPGGSVFAWVYTPQYGEPVEAPDEPSEEAEEQTIVYSHIFPNGVAELTLVRIESLEDDEDGFTLEVEPLSGKVHLHDEELDWEDLLDWLPEEAPELDL